jgi:hypothetical protein
MKLSRIYKNQKWICPSCKGKLSPETIILSPFSLDVIKAKIKMQTNLIFINKRGMIEINSMKYVEKSNFNKMLVCPKCKENILDGFLMELSPNTKNKEKTVNPRLNAKIKFRGYFDPEERLDDISIPVMPQPSQTEVGRIVEYTSSFTNSNAVSNAVINWGNGIELFRVSNPENLPEGNL